MFDFRVHATLGRARCGTLRTPHGEVDTPAFMPVGTRGAVKGILPEQLRQSGTQMILANTYHLLLRPGPDVVEALGGLHHFTGWEGPILTDSGGFQVYSLAPLVRIDDDGVEFRSHIDGAMLRLDPESAIEVQNRLGADIIMALDDCPALPAPRERLEQAVERTLRWAPRCLAAHRRPRDQALFAIVQGGTDADLRRRCAAALVAMDFAGYAVGGLSVGETHEEMVAALDALGDVLPADRPRYLMGVGMPRDLWQAVRRGMDLFDCVLPTRNGRNGYAFTAGGPRRLRNEACRTDPGPIEPGCPCPACRTFPVGYLRHLFLVGEMLGPILVSLHNVYFFQRLMATIREAIRHGTPDRVEEAFPIVRAEAGSHNDTVD